ncbi:MFS general substrate transporter [Rickenella mellea]|uniref:MFS general substrate transporter n=1 Tax=Rickenella mellea TaxID=50990 RepID=A0A4Y7Q5K0_9AGAM|nr:MFS general substrate transporter [Rickenella mellea]
MADHSLDEKSITGSSVEDLSHVDQSKLREVDVAIGIAAGHTNDEEISPEEAKRIRRKLDWHILPLLFLLYTLQNIDKSTLASASILGIIKDNKLTTDDFNNLNSAFYIGYLIFEWPQQWALQKFPVGKWLSFNIFLWCLFLGLHAVCHNFGGLFALRFLLGASEGCVTASTMLIISMFYNRTEIGQRIGWTFQCSGVGQIVSGFLSFGVFHANPKKHPNQWQWLMIATALMTFVLFILFVLFIPDNPTSARFLTPEEKLTTIKRIQANQNGIETKTFKMKQFIEAITDTKCILFFLFGAIADLQNGIGVQYSLVIKSLGFTTLQTTLLNIPSGFAQIFCVTLCCYLLGKFPNSRSWLNILFWIPGIVAAIVQIWLPFHNKVGHLIAIYVTNLGGAPSVAMMLAWVTSTCAGHTKKLTANGMFLIGYALGQILCTQFWKAQYKPRNIVPWIITLVTYFVDIAIVMAIRYVLITENKRRDALQAEAEASGKSLDEFSDLGYLDTVDESGKTVHVKVERALLDLTDKENLAFRYVL